MSVHEKKKQQLLEAAHFRYATKNFDPDKKSPMKTFNFF
ncbi:hypothetical protein D479_18394 [Halobacillus sp. BAB-2008]|nr:hypothetical protein D479_18394 [Halobacillus sp. BAB-2008]